MQLLSTTLIEYTRDACHGSMTNIPVWHLLLWPECFRRDLAIIYQCSKAETEQPGRWPAEESFLKAGLFTTDGAGPASHRRFHFYHPHLTGLKTTMQPLFILFFISGSQWKDKLVSWVFFHVGAQWAALPFSGVAGGPQAGLQTCRILCVQKHRLKSGRPYILQHPTHPAIANGHKTNLVQNYEIQWNPHIQVTWIIN